MSIYMDLQGDITMIDISDEKKRTYFWLREAGSPAMEIDLPIKLETIDGGGTHVIKNSIGETYVTRNWDLIKIEPKGIADGKKAT